MHNENWDDLRYVLAVAESGSVSGAARQLGVNHATVLRHVGSFEERHGVALFEKTSKGYTLPAEKLKIIEAAREVEAAVDAVTRLVQGTSAPLSGTIRLTSTDTFCTVVLPGLLERARRTLGVRFEVLTSNGHLDFARLHADVTVRPAVKLPDDLSGEAAAQLGFAVYAAGDSAEWLGLRGALAGSVAGRWLSETVHPEDMAGSADSFPVLLRMAEAGMGRAILPCILGDASPALRRTDDLDAPIHVPVWVASHADLADAPRLRAVRKAIAAGLADLAPVLAGEAGIR